VNERECSRRVEEGAEERAEKVKSPKIPQPYALNPIEGGLRASCVNERECSRRVEEGV
jgi:hypothetical protein